MLTHSHHEFAMSSLRLQQLLALKEQLGPPELQPHEKYSEQQASPPLHSSSSSSSSAHSGLQQPVFPFGSALMQWPERVRLDSRSADARMQELLAVLHQFVRPGAAAAGADIALATVRNTLFDVLVDKIWGSVVFESRGVDGLDVLNDEVSVPLVVTCCWTAARTHTRTPFLVLPQARRGGIPRQTAGWSGWPPDFCGALVSLAN